MAILLDRPVEQYPFTIHFWILCPHGILTIPILLQYIENLCSISTTPARRNARKPHYSGLYFYLDKNQPFIICFLFAEI